MLLSDYLAAEWKPAMGCTEPAAVAWAACLAAGQGRGPVRRVRLTCDPRTYKNCYAVGLPNSGRRTGILWALAIGAHLGDPALGLRGFEATTPAVLEEAGILLEHKGVQVEVDPGWNQLRIDVSVEREGGSGRALLEREHTNLARLERDGALVGGAASGPAGTVPPSLREALAGLSIAELMDLARAAGPGDRERLREGVRLNLAMAEHGRSLLPPEFDPPGDQDSRARLSSLVAGGVFARMSGEALPVMTLAGSGNKGITVSVPVALWGRDGGYAPERVDEALAFACLMTSSSTHQLGTLSAICGAANAAGIGIASALVLLGGGGPEQVGLAVNNLVGNLAGMVCDGAKIGCAMKTMTGVDAAFRAARLALAGVGIPGTDGIVGLDGASSLANLGRLAQEGMAGTDAVILDIMQKKLRAASAG
jgi:L-cysteine desulfidase